MLAAGSSISRVAQAGAAGREVAEGALAALEGVRPEVGLLFATPHYGAELEELLRCAVDTLGTEQIVGGTASAVLAGSEDAEDEPAVALLALGGVEGQAFLLRDLGGRERRAGPEIAARLGGDPTPTDLVVLLADATRLSARTLVTGLESALAPATVIGAGAAEDPTCGSWQWLGAQLANRAVAGVVLRGARRAEVRVTQACRPVTGLLGVTRASGHWVEALDGRPALDVYREVALGPLARDLRRAAAFLMVAIPVGGEESLARGHYRTRRVVGFSEERRAFAVPEALGRGQEIAFVLRDSDGARESLRGMLEAGDASPASGSGRTALYLSCSGRGRSLFGVAGLEVGYLDRALRGVPLAGMHGPCQIAPLAGRTELLTYAGILALVGG